MTDKGGPPKSPSKSFPPPTVPLILYSVAPFSCTTWPLWSSGPPAWLFHPQHPSSDTVSVPPLHMSKSSQSGLSDFINRTPGMHCHSEVHLPDANHPHHCKNISPTFISASCLLLSFTHTLLVSFPSYDYVPPFFSSPFTQPGPAGGFFLFFILTNVACSGLRLWASMNHYQVTLTLPDYISIKLNWVELNRFDSSGCSFRIELKCLRGGMWNSGSESF